MSFTLSSRHTAGFRLNNPSINRSILVVGHGSKLPEAVAEFKAFVAALSSHHTNQIQYCFMEMVEPDLGSGIHQAVEALGGSGELIILPLFLGGAGHQKNDVAVAVRWAKEKYSHVQFKYAKPLGPHAKLIELLDLRVREGLNQKGALSVEQTIVLVVGRGSSDPDSNGEIARSAYLLSERRPYRSVEYAFQAVAHPDLAEGMRRCKTLGANQVIVAPYLLFTGQVENDIHRVCDAESHNLGMKVMYAQHLGIHPLLLEVAEQCIYEAAEGNPAMNCDMCKYRWGMAGYEGEVGAAQVSHHFDKS